MTLEDIEKLYLSRRSCRSYDPTKRVDGDTLKKIVELAMLSPSACNSQPWKVYAVNEAEKVSQIADGCGKAGFNKFTKDCTAFVVICEARANLSERVGQKLTGNEFVSNDIGLMCAHLVLAAEAAGLSSCILGMFGEKEIKEVLDIPQKTKISLVVALGYPAEGEIKPKKRKELSEVAEFILE